MMSRLSMNAVASVRAACRAGTRTAAGRAGASLEALARVRAPATPRSYSSLSVRGTPAMTGLNALSTHQLQHREYVAAPAPVTQDTSASSSSGDGPSEHVVSSAVLTAPKGSRKQRYLQVSWDDGDVSEFHPMWLRHNCTCPECVEPSSGQLLIDLASLDKESTIRSVSVTDDQDGVCVEWGGSNTRPHQSVFRSSFLHSMRLRRERQASDASREVSQALLSPNSQGHSYDRVMSCDRALHDWLQELAHKGWAMVNDAPLDGGVVSALANRISRPQASIYGESFDVIAEENPINIAYSSLPLGLHQDLAYYESSPGLQFLHCRAFSDDVVGGESTLMDGFALAYRFRDLFPHEFETLTRVPVTFKKIHYTRAEPVHMTYRRPMIGVNSEGEVTNVAWSPPFQGVTETNTMEEMDDLYHALAKFAQLMEASTDLLHEFRLKPGQVFTFNNRRAFHGRRGFTLKKGSVRHLEGVYVNIDEFKSKVQVLCSKYGGSCPKHIGNQDLT